MSVCAPESNSASHLAAAASAQKQRTLRALALSRAETGARPSRTSRRAAAVRGSGGAAGSALHIPRVDIEGMLDLLLTEQMRHVAESTPEGAPPPDFEHIRRQLAASRLRPTDIQAHLEHKLVMLCNQRYDMVMPQSSRHGGMGLSAHAIRDGMQREMQNKMNAMLGVLRSGKAVEMPKLTKASVRTVAPIDTLSLPSIGSPRSDMSDVDDDAFDAPPPPRPRATPFPPPQALPDAGSHVVAPPNTAPTNTDVID